VNVHVGTDDTLFAVADGIVKFKTLPGGRKQVSVEPVPAQTEAAQ
jgi:large subunit ribosomal protein L27